jgi:hypothetical protein
MFPFVALVAMIAIGAIMFLLKHGNRYLNNRHFVWSKASDEDLENRAAYSQNISVSVAQ